VNARRHAIVVGLRRGWTEFVLSVRSSQDQSFYLFMGVALLGYLWLNRDSTVDGSTLPFVAFAMPSLLGGLVVFGAVMGPASALALERQDGTLLRSRLVPHGMTGYVAGQLTLQVLSVVPLLGVVLVPSALLFDGVMWRGADGWLIVVVAIALGLFATLPIGMVLGAVIPGGPQKLGLYAMLPLSIMVGISGIFVPVTALWGWVQVLAQSLPMYWLGHLMRWAFLPEGSAMLEAGGAFRPVVAVLVLVAWGVVGTLLAPPTLRRMSRRQSGSQVAAARDDAAQFVR
jgi:ABC-2 type transport system permease protein